MQFRKISSVRFPDDNEIFYLMDHAFWQNVPSDIDFYVSEVSDHYVTFIGDGYGILDKHGLAGKYGNGSISIPKEYIPELIEWATENILIQPPLGEGIKK